MARIIAGTFQLDSAFKRKLKSSERERSSISLSTLAHYLP